MAKFDKNKRTLMLGVMSGLGIYSSSELAIGNIVQPLTQPPINIHLYNIHTREEITLEFDRNNRLPTNKPAEINTFFRDYRTDETCAIDFKLLQQLQRLDAVNRENKTYELISGFRAQSTNDWLRKMGKNVAKQSYHIEGRAIDIRLRGTDSSVLFKAALSMRAGGVGYYRQSNFIHLDTGPVRYWGN